MRLESMKEPHMPDGAPNPDEGPNYEVDEGPYQEGRDAFLMQRYRAVNPYHGRDLDSSDIEKWLAWEKGWGDEALADKDTPTDGDSL